ncbi:MAG: CPBP family intramembrane metalloprotease [Anaerolineae bacterium]|nr:CPBP family intramembrane metalloprotease [Anaerolineae bacterium]
MRFPWAPILLIACVAIVIWLKRVRGWAWAKFWRSGDIEAEKREFWRILLRFGIIAPLLAWLVWLVFPEKSFNLMFSQPRLWLAILFFYPIFSVYPQELLFRAFFFERYGDLGHSKWLPVIINAIAFGWAHVFFPSPLIAVGLCILGGLLFANSYARTRSLRLVVFEHALFGDLIFTIGLGEFFFSGRRVAG